MVLISTVIPNPTAPPAKIIIKHSSYLNRFAVKDHIPAINAKTTANAMYNVFTVFLFVTEAGSIPLRR